jgi:hypothetical protein
VVAGAFDVRGADPVGLGGALLEFGGDGEGSLDGQRGQGVEQQLPDAPVKVGARDAGADPFGVGDAVTLADVAGEGLAAAVVVAHGHPLPAPAADDDSLQQGRPLAGRAGGAVAAVRGGVGGEPGAVGVELVEGDVARVRIRDERGPLLAGQRAGRSLPVRAFLVAVAAVGDRAGVAGVVQHPQHGVMLQRFPVQLAPARSLEVPPREAQAGPAERLDAGGRGPGGGEGVEQVPDRLAHGGVRVEHHVSGRAVDQPDRQRGDQLTAAGLGQHAAAQPGALSPVKRFV